MLIELTLAVRLLVNGKLLVVKFGESRNGYTAILLLEVSVPLTPTWCKGQLDKCIFLFTFFFCWILPVDRFSQVRWGDY